MHKQGIPLILLMLCAALLSSCASTQITKVGPSNPHNNIVWKITTKSFGKPKALTEVFGEFSVKITGPAGEIFERLSSPNLVSYEVDGTAKLRVTVSKEGLPKSLVLATVNLSPNWQSRYDNGEKVQVPEKAEISFLGEQSVNSAILKADGFPDPYSVVVRYKAKHDPKRPARLLKERKEREAAEQRAREAENKKQAAQDAARQKIIATAKKYISSNGIISASEMSRASSGQGSFSIYIKEAWAQGDTIVKALVSVEAFMPFRGGQFMQPNPGGAPRTGRLSGGPNMIQGQLLLEKSRNSWRVTKTSDSLR